MAGERIKPRADMDSLGGTSGTEYRQCSAPRSQLKDDHTPWGQAVESQDRSQATRVYPKPEGSGADAVEAGAKGVYPRTFPKGGWYDPASPAENQLNKEEKILSGE